MVNRDNFITKLSGFTVDVVPFVVENNRPSICFRYIFRQAFAITFDGKNPVRVKNKLYEVVTVVKMNASGIFEYFKASPFANKTFFYKLIH